MDSRWKFLHYRRNEAVTQKDSSGAVMVNCVKVSSVGCSEVRIPESMRHERTEVK
jgi:hypothetical protein